ncbi:MAG: hypothetical protein GY880_07555, partial [Planctomycetaceae bacterium]|nr:hypothetical protein [Planctomycetaceae bacterium]
MQMKVARMLKISSSRNHRVPGITLEVQVMAKQYYIKRAGRISGPFSGSDVKSGIQMGRLLEQDLISLSKDGPWRT